MKTWWSFVLVAVSVLILTQGAPFATSEGQEAGHRWAHQSLESALLPENGPVALLQGLAVDESVPTPDEFLGFEFCSRATHSEAVNAYLKCLADASPRIEVRTYGTTYEGRELCYAVVSSEENIRNLENIKGSIALLADPRQTSETEAIRAVSATPAIAWFEFSIHGDELSGVDAALFLAYYLVAVEDSLTKQVRDNVVIIVDPNQNPDGRERFLALLSQWKSTRPNPDNQSVEHSTFWPWGRGNHYLFDLNRDWIPFLNSETRARAAAILDWHPQLLVDAHEMGAFESFLFSPPREPFNPNVTASLKKWLDVFSRDQARAFDKFGWSYYTKEWNEEWGPFYANVWASHTGAIGILYEQAGVEGTGVRRPDGTYLGYPESVFHHVVGSIANLETLASNRKEILADFYNDKRRVVSAARAGGYVIPPTGNRTRLAALVGLLQSHGIEVHKAKAEFVARDVKSGSGDKLGTKQFPAGTHVIPFAQPMGLLLKTIFEFDPRMTTSFLEDERDELERHGETKLYEVSAWSVPLAFDLETYEVGSYGSGSMEKVTAADGDEEQARGEGKRGLGGGAVVNPDAEYGFLLDFSDDAVLFALPMLFEKGCRVRVTIEPLRTHGVQYDRGALLVTTAGNPENLVSIIEDVAAATGARFYGVSSASSEDGPDLGGNYVRLLQEPRVAIVTGPGIDITSFGLTWYLLDRTYGYRFSTLDASRLGEVDLEKYNVLILPSVWGSHAQYFDILGKKAIAGLKRWVENQGTLICIGAASAFAADTTSGLSKVRLRRQALDALDEFEEALAREGAMKERELVDSLTVWRGVLGEKASGKESKEALSRTGVKTGASSEGKPDKNAGGPPAGKPDVEKLKREDEWSKRFMPRGAILKADVDEQHWLSFGMGKNVPVMLYSEYALLSKFPVETACRLSGAAELRLSGLVWPEGRTRWARTAYATRERVGRGQVILFAGHPYFRGYFHGSGRMLFNAIFLGPGLGTAVPVPW
jgi:hypothetical protein